MPEIKKCSICHRPIKVKNFGDMMSKFRKHRKRFHPRQFRESIKKGMATRKRNRR